MSRSLFVLLSVCFITIVSAATAEQPPIKYLQPFNGKDTKVWKVKGNEKDSLWKVGVAKLDEKDNSKLTVTPAKDAAAGELVNVKTGGGGLDIYTEEKFGDCRITLQLMVPKGSNSGVYVMGEYEVQILDSFGKKDAEIGPGDIGAIYGAAKPTKNLAKAPGEWQTLEIDFIAPRFEKEKKVANAKFKRVALNGTVIHENVEVPGPTPSSLTGKEAPTGPLLFQGDHGPVAFRDIRVIPN